MALGALGDAYEQLDEESGDRLEEQLFRPVQTAYGRAKRTYGDFAARYDLRTREFATTSRGAPSRGVQAFIEEAAEAVDEAENVLIVLQDSMRPVEVGDAELRAGLAETRTLVAELRDRTSAFMRTFGR